MQRALGEDAVHILAPVVQLLHIGLQLRQNLFRGLCLSARALQFRKPFSRIAESQICFLGSLAVLPLPFVDLELIFLFLAKRTSSLKRKELLHILET